MTLIDLQGHSFQLFLSENNCNLFLRSLTESPGNLTMDDITDDFE